MYGMIDCARELREDVKKCKLLLSEALLFLEEMEMGYPDTYELTKLIRDIKKEIE